MNTDDEIMSYNSFREKYAFWGLLLSMTMAFILTPFIHHDLYPLNMFIISAFLFSIITLGDNRTHLILSCIAIAPMFLSIIFLTVKHTTIFLYFFISTGLFFTLIIIVFMQRIFSSTVINTNTLLMSICIYYAMAVVWAMIYGMLLYFMPESYNFQHTTIHQENINNLMYFSLVTLTTLGYGDIHPLTPEAKSLAAMESFMGQIYLTVLVARLVGLHIASQSANTSLSKSNNQ